jgi:hypothetical protein
MADPHADISPSWISNLSPGWMDVMLHHGHERAIMTVCA